MDTISNKIKFFVNVVVFVTVFNSANVLAQQVPQEAYVAAETKLKQIQESLFDDHEFYRRIPEEWELDNKEDILKARVGDPTKAIRLFFKNIHILSSSGDNLLSNTEFMYYTFPIIVDGEVKAIIDVCERDNKWKWYAYSGAEYINQHVYESQQAALEGGQREYYYLWIDTTRHVLVNDNGAYSIIPINHYAASVFKEIVHNDKNGHYLPIEYSKALPMLREFANSLQRWLVQ